MPCQKSLIVARLTHIENDGSFYLLFLDMLNDIFPFLHIREVFGVEFSFWNLLILNGPFIIALYVIIIILFRKILIYSYYLLFFNIFIGFILVIYLYFMVKIYSSWYEFGSLGMLTVWITWLCFIVSFPILLADFIWIPERKASFQFWKFEKYLIVLLWIDITYLLVAILLYFLD